MIGAGDDLRETVAADVTPSDVRAVALDGIGQIAAVAPPWVVRVEARKNGDSAAGQAERMDVRPAARTGAGDDVR
jgi:hypothetical protein